MYNRLSNETKFKEVVTLSKRSMKLKYMDLAALKGLVREKKESYEKVALVLNMAQNTFYNKINGYGVFDTKEIDIITTYLDIAPEMITYYFFPHMLSDATKKENLSKNLLIK
jgi:hypothetical protein